MLDPGRILPALLAGCALWLAPAALASEPAAVTVRVEGISETKLPATLVTTTTAPVVRDGNPEHSCAGTGALGALALAARGAWSGPWNEGFKQYEIYSIEGETHLFEPGSSANYYWSFWLDDKEAEVGACEAQLAPGDRVLFFPSCYGSACPPSSLPLELEAPSTARAGEPVTVTVHRYSTAGVASAAAGATVTGGASSAVTDSSGHATVTFGGAEEATLRVSAPESVRTEASVCVYVANDGLCGTPLGSPGFAPHSESPTPVAGPSELTAHTSSVTDGRTYSRSQAPRVISGVVLSRDPVASVSLELRRRYRGRCYAYDAISERFRRARCGHASAFKVAAGASFSYLLPAALPAGRYVLDILARDDAGQRTALARGSTRVVFDVR